MDKKRREKTSVEKRRTQIAASIEATQISFRMLRETYAREDEYEDAVRREYFKGVRHGVAEQAWKFLEDEFGTQGAIADVLGRDRTAVNKLKRESSIDAPALSFLLLKDSFNLDKTNTLDRGMLEAISWTQRNVIREPIEEELTIDRYLGLYERPDENDPWYAAFVLTIWAVEDGVGR